MHSSEHAFEEEFLAALERGLSQHALAPLRPLVEGEIKARLAAFASLLFQANRESNLTRITDPGEMAVKHVIDSMTALLVGEWPQGATVCDVGTGGGLPGIVLGLVRPDLCVSMVDSVAKKVAAVQEMVGALGLDVRVIHARAEDLGRDPDHRERYRVVVARAVARLPTLAELCLPLTAVGGHFVAMKGRDSELEEGRFAICELGGDVDGTLTFDLPEAYGTRTLVSVVKVRKSPATYPRRSGLPAKRPLLSVR